MPKAMVMIAMPLGQASGDELNRTKAVVDPTIAKNDTPNTSADIVSISAECPNSGTDAPMALTPRMMVVERPPLFHASTRFHTQGVTNALAPIRHQNALCAAAPPQASRT